MSNASVIQLNLRLQRGTFTLDVQAALPSHGVTVIFGPSGCGKTSLLRAVAGFEQAATGEIVVNGSTWQDSTTSVFLPTWQRPLGYVFQEPSLFEHLSAEGNMRYGLKRAQPAGGEAVLQQAIELLGLGGLLKRSVASLSGGERQRVAIARALATQPQLLLLDEPLAAIDMARRNDILPWLERLKSELSLPMLYVTHAADELTRLADHVLTLNAGQVQHNTSIAQAMSDLENPVFPANQACAVLRGQVVEVDASWGLARVAVGQSSLWVPKADTQVGDTLRCRIAAHEVSLSLNAATADSSVQNHVLGEVLQIKSNANEPLAMVAARCGDATLLARTTRRALHGLNLQIGMPIWLHIKAASVLV